MSKFWYLLVLVLLVLGVWLFIKGCPPSNDDDAPVIDPPYAGTIGFDSIKVDGDLIMNLLKPQSDTFPGFRVYNARMPHTTTNSPGLILVATDKDSFEIDGDGTLKYVYIDPNGSFESGLSKGEARRAVIEVVKNPNYLNLITDFSYNTIRSHWPDSIPLTIDFIPATYNQDGVDFSTTNIMYLTTPSEGKDYSLNMIPSEPCPPNCPLAHKLLYNWGMELLSDDDSDDDEDKNDK